LALEKQRERQKEKDERIGALRKSDRQKARKRVNDLALKMENATKSKEENASIANKQIWLKREATRLKNNEITEDKDFFDNERKAQSLLILQKHE
jgi:hypothetical protein